MTVQLAAIFISQCTGWVVSDSRSSHSDYGGWATKRTKLSFKDETQINKETVFSPSEIFITAPALL